MSKLQLTIITLSLLIFTASGTASRQRITLAPMNGIYSEEDIEKEILFGREMAAIILAGRKLSATDELSRYINMVGQSIVSHTDRPEINFYFAVIESPEINAYAAPGGYIFITTSALYFMQNEAELAGVLAHEIAHVSARHIVNTLKIRADDESMTAAVSKIVGSHSNSANVVFDQAVANALELLFSKGLKIGDEYSADQQGVFLTALAGYDPAAYNQFLQRIKPVIETNSGELSNTHPPFSERITRLKTIIDTESLSELGNFLNQQRFMQHTQTGE